MVERPSSGGGVLPLIVLLLMAAVGTLVLNQPASPPPVTADLPMLQDPEAEVHEWKTDVWAYSKADAMRECRRIEKTQELTELIGVQQVYKKPSKLNQFLFYCLFRSEVESEPYFYDPQPNS